MDFTFDGWPECSLQLIADDVFHHSHGGHLLIAGKLKGVRDETNSLAQRAILLEEVTFTERQIWKVEGFKLWQELYFINLPARQSNIRIMNRNTEKFILIILLAVLIVSTFGCLQYAINDFSLIRWNLEQLGYAGSKREQLYKFTIVAIPTCVLVLCFMRFRNIWQDQDEAQRSDEKNKERIEEQLRRLDDMYRRKIIDDIEYNQKRAELLLRL